MRQKLSIVIVFMLMDFLLGACQGASALPRAKEGTLLRKIQDRGKLMVGVRYDIPTFGYMNSQTKALEGFDPAMGREIAGYIFGNSNKIEFKETTAKDRIPFLKDGTVDVVLSTFAINTERQKEVDFSITYYASSIRLLTWKNGSIKSLVDLEGKTVGANRDGIPAQRLSMLPGTRLVLVDSFAQGIQALSSGQVDAIGGADISLFGLALQYPEFQVVGQPISSELFGAGVAKGNSELLEVINTVIRNVKTSGKWQAIWKAEIGDKLGIRTIPDPPPDDWGQ